MWAVIAGLIGSRIYHVITDWKNYQGNWGEVWQIWEGGLGIPGAVAVAAAVMWVYARQKGHPCCLISPIRWPPPSRWAKPSGGGATGSTRRLYGRPSDLPWALEIDPENRRLQYLDDDTFHPTFLYECIWNLALVGALLWVAKRFTLKPGRLFGLYVLGYSLGRLWIEFIRVDFASELAGVRVNIWVMLALIIGSVAYLLWDRGGDAEDEAAENVSLEH